VTEQPAISKKKEERRKKKEEEEEEEAIPFFSHPGQQRVTRGDTK